MSVKSANSAATRPIFERFRASGWHVQEIDGHDTDAIRDAITAARAVTDKPSMIACKTVIGFGFPTKAGTQKAHSDAPGEEEIAGARKTLGWASPPFVIPEGLLREWRGSLIAPMACHLLHNLSIEAATIAMIAAIG